MLSESNSNPTKPALSGERLSPLGSETDPPAKPSSPAIPSHTQPQIDWSFFASLSLPGENAVYTLHDGELRFIEATPGCERIWGASLAQLRSETLSSRVQDCDILKAWLLDLERQAERTSYHARLLAPVEGNDALDLKAIPIFVSPDPRQTRIAIKAAPVQDASSQVKGFPLNLNFSSTHAFCGRFETASVSWAELLGGDVSQFKELSLANIVIETDRPHLESFLAEAGEADSVRSRILRFKAHGDRVKTLLLSARRDANRSKLIVEAKNITVEADNPAMDLLKTSIELVKESVLLLMKVGPSYRICYANRAFEDMTGYRYSRVAGSSLSCLHGPKTNARAILDIEEALQKEKEHNGNLLLYRKNGDAFWANAYLIPLRDNSGQASHFTAILEDATEVRTVSDELARKNEELQSALKDLKETQKAIIQQESLRALGQMASGIAHDFNNLLAPILGFSELLLTVPKAMQDEKKLISYLKKIQVAAQDGAAVVSRLREFYRSQNSPEEFIQIQPEELLWQVKELTRHRWKNQAEAKGRNIQFKMEIGSSRSILGNEPELRQVFTNLIINAVDAMDRDGSITVSVSDAKELVRIEISDTGCGMNEETRRKCLEPFYTTKGKLGTGLGLSIVFGVVQRHHGTFDIQSTKDVGTRIVMQFPSVKPAQKAKADSDATANSKSLNIMLVDDEEVLLEVVSELLVSGGHTVDVYSDPNHSIDAFKEKRYDLVITDRAMPLMSGDQLAAIVKDIEPKTPVFMITGFGDLIKDSGDLPENVDAILAKPVPLDVLNRKLAELAHSK